MKLTKTQLREIIREEIALIKKIKLNESSGLSSSSVKKIVDILETELGVNPITVKTFRANRAVFVNSFTAPNAKNSLYVEDLTDGTWNVYIGSPFKLGGSANIVAHHWDIPQFAKSDSSGRALPLKDEKTVMIAITTMAKKYKTKLL